jgi:hypothetical protein
MTAQLYALAAHTAAPGIKVRLHRSCTKCGCTIGPVGPAVRPHVGGNLRYTNCLRFQRWLSQHERAIVTRAGSSPFVPEILSLPPRRQP